MPLPFYAYYSGTLTNAGGDTDLLEISPASNKPVKIRRLILGQTSEVGDAAEEIVRISIIRLPATFTTSNGSSVTKTYPSSASGAAALRGTLIDGAVTFVAYLPYLSVKLPDNIVTIPMPGFTTTTQTTYVTMSERVTRAGNTRVTRGGNIRATRLPVVSYPEIIAVKMDNGVITLPVEAQRRKK